MHTMPTTTSAAQPAKTAGGKTDQKVTSPVKAAASTPKNMWPEKFDKFKKVRLRLLEPNTIQYDPSYPELILDTTKKRGKLMPLTPFFASRIGTKVELAD